MTGIPKNLTNSTSSEFPPFPFALQISAKRIKALKKSIVVAPFAVLVGKLKPRRLSRKRAASLSDCVAPAAAKWSSATAAGDLLDDQRRCHLTLRDLQKDD